MRANEQNEYQDCLEKAGTNAFPKDIEDCLHMSHMEFIGMGDLMAGCMDEEFTTLEEMETEVAECLGEEIPERVDGEDRLLFSGTVVGATSWYVTCKTSHCASWWCPSSLCWWNGYAKSAGAFGPFENLIFFKIRIKYLTDDIGI